MKTLQEKATLHATVVWTDENGKRKELLDCGQYNAFIAGYETHQHETRWRSVEEELPELYTPVLVKRNPDVFGGNPAEHQLCYLAKHDDGEIAWFQSEIDISACRITHWKPIE